MLKFARAWIDILGEAYFLEPQSGAGGAAAAICEDTDSEPEASDASDSSDDSDIDEPEASDLGPPQESVGGQGHQESQENTES